MYLYIFIDFSPLARSRLRTRTFIPLALIYSCLRCNKNGDRPEITITKKKEKKKKKTQKTEGGRRVRPRGRRTAAVLLPITDSCSREDTVCSMLGHQRGGGGGSFPVERLSRSWRFSSATSKGMISTQPMAPKSAKSRRSSSSEEELSSCISVDRSSSWTNRLRSARSPSRNCRSVSDILGSFNRANRNWELWDEDEGLLSPAVEVLAVAALGGGMALPVFPGLLPRRVAWRPVSTCCRAAWACCRSN